MRNFRHALIVLLAPVLLTGCDSGNSVETTLPTTPPAVPPEADQMKNEIIKNLKLKTPKDSAAKK